MFLFQGSETHARSILKAVSWRTLGTLDTFAISWFMMGKVAITGSIAAAEIFNQGRLVLSTRANLGGRIMGKAVIAQ